jgi:hypothetical protein
MAPQIAMKLRRPNKLRQRRCQYNIIDLPSKRDLATSKSSEVFYRKKACEVF